APIGVSVSAVSNSSLNVTILPPIETAGISQYNVTLNDTSIKSSCEIEVGKKPLDCEVRGLSAGTNYVVKACSWTQIGHLCSDFVEAAGWTKPHGRFC
uniref:Fibronectin type-III domain-containing protein n=1 Tax=Mesocestoides corti TaxID=53468 RepID=A0A5K3FZ87_MESCO